MNNDFEKYWNLRMTSATARLAAAQHIIKNHNPTRGSTTESALRTLLREFLPQRCGIGTGFMLAANGETSRQLDIIVFDQLESAPLYHDADLVILPPDSVYLVIEVKSRLDRSALGDAFDNIRSVKKLNANTRGLVFGYESATAETLKEQLAEQKLDPRLGVPDQILCLERNYFISWDAAKASYDGYELEHGPTHQLINEVLNASDVTNLKAYLPRLTPTRHLFTI